ncbi:MAG TPA: hypothetical protein VGL56_03275 [Fimbriimonadaceae bacterium]|jgi:hypothetical protein
MISLLLIFHLAMTQASAPGPPLPPPPAQEGVPVPIDQLPGRPTTKDFKLPKSFRSDDYPIAADYLDVYKVKNTREKLPTWKLYNLCRLILAANADTYKDSGQTFEVGTQDDLFSLLQFNVPNLDLDNGQYAEVYFLAGAAYVIRKRFGVKLEALTSLRHTPRWHQVWMDQQHWHGISFGNFVLSYMTTEFDIVNLDPVAHSVKIGLEVYQNGKFEMTTDKMVFHKETWKINDWKDLPLSESGFCAATRREHFRLSAPVKRGTMCKLVMQVDGKPGAITSGHFIAGDAMQHIFPILPQF